MTTKNFNAKKMLMSAVAAVVFSFVFTTSANANTTGDTPTTFDYPYMHAHFDYPYLNAHFDYPYLHNHFDYPYLHDHFDYPYLHDHFDYPY